MEERGPAVRGAIGRSIIAGKEFAVLTMEEKNISAKCNGRWNTVPVLKCAINHRASVTMLIARIKLNRAVLWGSLPLPALRRDTNKMLITAVESGRLNSHTCRHQ